MFSLPRAGREINNMVALAVAPRRKRPALLAKQRSLNEAQFLEMKEMFRIADKDNSGGVSVDELAEFLQVRAPLRAARRQHNPLCRASTRGPIRGAHGCGPTAVPTLRGAPCRALQHTHAGVHASTVGVAVGA